MNYSNFWRRSIIFFRRNNNQMMILKLVRKLLGMNFNYALSLELPYDSELRDRHLIDMKLLSGDHGEDEILTDDQEATIKRIVWYRKEFAFTLKDTLVDAETGIAFLDSINPKAVSESSNILPIEVSDYLRPRSPSKVDKGTWTCLSSRSYAHWLLQDVPRFLRTISHFPEAEIVVKDSPPLYVSSFLDAIGRNSATQRTIIKPEKYVFVGSQYAVGLPSMRDLDTLRNIEKKFVSEKYECGSLPNSFYVSRSKSQRNLPGEHEVEKRLISLGFEIVFLEDLTFEKQVKLFRNAKIVIGAHGAGMANMIWCQPNTKIIEIYDTKFIQGSMFALSKKLDLDFVRVSRRQFDEINEEVLIE